MRKSILIFLCGTVWLISAAGTVRAQVTITPRIIDEISRARDKLEYSINIINRGDSYVELYAVVSDFDPDKGQQSYTNPHELDDSVSLARWIRIKRGGIELKPGSEVNIPLTVEVSPFATPGKRHAVISFSGGSNVYDARDRASSNNLAVFINLDIEDEIIERAQITEFGTNRDVYLKPPVEFYLEVENIGNWPVKPHGYIYIYNRRGEEVDRIDINQDLTEIAPDNNTDFSSSWSVPGGFGKYKARLEAEYGEKVRRDLQDTLFFWILPWKLLALVGGGILILIMIMTILIFKRTYYHPHPEVTMSDGVINLKEDN